MSIYNREDDGTIETLHAGQGFSVLKERDGPRLRFDVWDGDGETSRCVPFMVETVSGVSGQYRAALERLRSDALRFPELQAPVERLAAALNG